MEKSLNTIKWILLASLLINAAFAGFVFSQVTNHWGFGFGGPRPGPMREMVVRGNFNAKGPEASEQTRAVLTKVFASEQGDMEQAVKEWVEARRNTVKALRAQPLDKAALETALADMRAKTVAAQEVYHRVVLQAAPELSAQERVLLARILNASPNRFGANAVLNPNAPIPASSMPASPMPAPPMPSGAGGMVGPPPPPKD